jgi:transcriptional regulator with XRE-family HTH domain
MRRRARDPEYRAELQRLAPYETLARIVIRRRGQLELSQAELARRMGTSHSAISRIESGHHPTTVQTLRRLAEALETHLVVGFVDEISELGENSSSTDAPAADLVAVS